MGPAWIGARPAYGYLSRSTGVTQDCALALEPLGSHRELCCAVLCCWEGAGFESLCVWQGSLPCCHKWIGLSSLGRLHSLKELVHALQIDTTFLGLCLCHCILGSGGKEPEVGSEPGMGSDSNFCILCCPHFPGASGTCRRALIHPLYSALGSNLSLSACHLSQKLE